MANASSATGGDDLKGLAARVTALEDSRASTDTDPSTRGDDVARHANVDFVRQEEFRLFKWLGSFALVAVLGGFGLIYERISDVRVTMERLHADMERLHAEMLQALHTHSVAVRDEIAGVRERVVRLETLDGTEDQ